MECWLGRVAVLVHPFTVNDAFSSLSLYVSVSLCDSVSVSVSSPAISSSPTPRIGSDTQWGSITLAARMESVSMVTFLGLEWKKTRV